VFDGARNKAAKLALLSQSDHVICLNETNLSESDTSLLAKYNLGPLAKIKALGNISFKNGRRTVPRVNGKIVDRKRKEFGTAIISKLWGGVKVQLLRP
jgi:hypothetical protein